MTAPLTTADVWFLLLLAIPVFCVACVVLIVAEWRREKRVKRARDLASLRRQAGIAAGFDAGWHGGRR